MLKLIKLFCYLGLLLGYMVWSLGKAGTVLYIQQEVRPTAVFDYMPPINIPIYLTNGPYLITRGLGNAIYQFPSPLYGSCIGFIAHPNQTHGQGPLVLQTKDKQVGISLSGPSQIRDPNNHLISALYVDYFSTGDDIRPWMEAEALVLETQVATPEVYLEEGDIGYVQYSILLEDTISHQFIWWVWQVYDSRINSSYETLGVDTTVDGGGYSYVTTSFAPIPLQYSTTLPGSTYFQYNTWNELKWFGSKITRQNFIAGINSLTKTYSQNIKLSKNPDVYQLRKFYYYSEMYLQNPRISKSRICTQSYRALLRNE